VLRPSVVQEPRVQAVTIRTSLVVILYANALYIVPKGYYRPNIIEVVDKDFTSSNTISTSTTTNYFFFNNNNSSNPPPPILSTPYSPSSI